MFIGNVEIQNPVVLAPMAGVTDLPFRVLCREQGCGMVCTEMVSAKALCYGDNKTKSLLYNLPGCRPFAAQIFGHEPEIMAQAAPMAIEYSGADMLDINMGCPVGKVVNGETEVVFGEGGMEHVGPVMAKLRENLEDLKNLWYVKL